MSEKRKCVSLFSTARRKSERTMAVEARSPELTRAESSLSIAGDARELSFKVDTFRQYLRQLLPLLLNADAHELELMLDASGFEDKASKWANDPAAGVIYIVKMRDQIPGDDSSQSRPTPRRRMLPLTLHMIRPTRTRKQQLPSQHIAFLFSPPSRDSLPHQAPLHPRHRSTPLYAAPRPQSIRSRLVWSRSRRGSNRWKWSLRRTASPRALGSRSRL